MKMNKERNFWDKYFEMSDLDDLSKLANVKHLDEYTDDIKTMLISMYENNHLEVKQSATIVNAIFCQHKKTFILTWRSLNELLSLDENTKTNTTQTKTYKMILSFLFKKNIIKILRQSTRSKGGVYQLIDSEIVKLLHEHTIKERLNVGDFYEAQEMSVLDYYDEKHPETRKIKENKNKWLDIRRKADGTRKV